MITLPSYPNNDYSTSTSQIILYIYSSRTNHSCSQQPIWSVIIQAIKSYRILIAYSQLHRSTWSLSPSSGHILPQSPSPNTLTILELVHTLTAARVRILLTLALNFHKKTLVVYPSIAFPNATAISFGIPVPSFVLIISSLCSPYVNPMVSLRKY